ncbi:MAG: hypothetical protein ACJA1A_000365 [Saprospiraceae bacterium]|jgi:hypothetical protein
MGIEIVSKILITTGYYDGFVAFKEQIMFS